jgi:tetratricopeptide (TPR) repeat protein
VFGTDEHATIATMLSNIGLVLDNQSQYEEALEHYNKSLEINRIVFRTDEHASIATTLSNIGSVLDKQGKMKKLLNIISNH